MAVIRSNSRYVPVLDTALAFFQRLREQFEDARAKRQVYWNTYHELSRLTDRELADIGIPRSTIGRVARESSYGC